MAAADPGNNTTQLGDRFEDALAFAAELHGDDVRKGSHVPYMAHLLGVCSLVLEEGGSEEQAIAALLHDAAEDHGGSGMLEKIRPRFGERVTKIVEACSDTLDHPKPEWRPRKKQYLQRLASEPEEALLVSLADKLYNARAIQRDYELVGEELWDRFSTSGEEDRGRGAQLWYYRSLRAVFRRRAPEWRMTGEFAAVVDRLEKLVEEGPAGGPTT